MVMEGVRNTVIHGWDHPIQETFQIEMEVHFRIGTEILSALELLSNRRRGRFPDQPLQDRRAGNEGVFDAI